MALLFRSEGEQDWVIAWDVFGIRTEREINWELGEDNKAYAYAMLGYGAVTSYIFIVGCLIKYIGYYLNKKQIDYRMYFKKSTFKD